MSSPRGFRSKYPTLPSPPIATTCPMCMPRASPGTACGPHLPTPNSARTYRPSRCVWAHWPDCPPHAVEPCTAPWSACRAPTCNPCVSEGGRAARASTREVSSRAWVHGPVAPDALLVEEPPVLTPLYTKLRKVRRPTTAVHMLHDVRAEYVGRDWVAALMPPGVTVVHQCVATG